MTNMKNIVYLSAASLFILISLTYLATTPIWPFNKEDMFAQCRNSKVTGGTASIGGTLELVAADGNTVSDVETQMPLICLKKGAFKLYQFSYP